MSIFAGISEQDDIQTSGDRLGGAQVHPSDLYAGVIKMAYVTPSSTGALGVHLEIQTECGKAVRSTQYITTGTAKGCKNYFEKDGVRTYLPGYELINDLALLTTNQTLKSLDPAMEEKLVPIYNADAKGEIPTKVPVIVPVLGQKIKFGLLQVEENKSKKNPATGQYDPTNDKVMKNELVKFFHYDTGLTVTEAQAGKTEGEFIVAWVEKNKGKVVDKFKAVTNQPATGGIPNAPGPSAAPGAAARPSLFPQK